jgi:NAD-dependent deacetylase
MKIVVFTGAGMSKESGIDTFRDSGGTWEKEDVESVATPAGWKADRERVLDFYNARRVQLDSVEPNEGHKLVAELEKDHEVTVITQNVDNLHERAGSTKVLHLHGELTKVQSSLDPTLVYDVGYKPTEIGDKCDKGSQLRPHVVWFGEYPNNVTEAYEALGECDVLLIVGTTLFIEYTTTMLGSCRILHNKNMGRAEVFFVDPNPPTILDHRIKGIEYIKEPATTGIKTFKDGLETFMKDIDGVIADRYK